MNLSKYRIGAIQVVTKDETLKIKNWKEYTVDKINHLLIHEVSRKLVPVDSPDDEWEGHSIAIRRELYVFTPEELAMVIKQLKEEMRMDYMLPHVSLT